MKIPGYYLYMDNITEDDFVEFGSWRRTDCMTVYIYETPCSIGIMDFDVEHKSVTYYDVTGYDFWDDWEEIPSQFCHLYDEIDTRQFTHPDIISLSEVLELLKIVDIYEIMIS